MVVVTKTLRDRNKVGVYGHLCALSRKKVLEHGGISFSIRKGAGEGSAGHWSEETLQTLRPQGEIISRGAWKENIIQAFLRGEAEV